MLILTAVNMTDLAPVSDYEYEVRINRTIIARGRVTGHTRTDGWRALIARILGAM